MEYTHFFSLLFFVTNFSPALSMLPTAMRAAKQPVAPLARSASRLTQPFTFVKKPSCHSFREGRMCETYKNIGIFIMAGPPFGAAATITLGSMCALVSEKDSLLDAVPEAVLGGFIYGGILGTAASISLGFTAALAHTIGPIPTAVGASSLLAYAACRKYSEKSDHLLDNNENNHKPAPFKHNKSTQKPTY